jgi:hypothetical protein
MYLAMILYMSDTIFHGTSGPYRIPSPWERREKLEAMSLEQLSAELAVVLKRICR